MAILGIDEVGRGPLAGPLVVGAVILPEEELDWILELRDSKKLSAKKRAELSELILSGASATGLGWVGADELDEVGISEALRLATRRAVELVQEAHVKFSQIIIDGKVNFLKETALADYVSMIPKADDLVREVSAASIIAKMARDNYMMEIAQQYPEYGFERHVGYGTVAHRKAIMEFGVCPEHRLSFEPCKSLVGFIRGNDEKKNTTKVGSRAEDVVAEYLVRRGHKIVARNYKTRLYEIDIVSIYQDKIFFTEVKYRRDEEYGGGWAAVNKSKIARMEFAAEDYMRSNSEYIQYDPALAVASVSGDFVVDGWLEV